MRYALVFSLLSLSALSCASRPTPSEFEYQKPLRANKNSEPDGFQSNLVLTRERNELAREQLERLTLAYNAFRQEHGFAPRNLLDLSKQFSTGGIPKDPWGGAWRLGEEIENLEFERRGVRSTIEARLPALISGGPDTIYRTPDDIIWIDDVARQQLLDRLQSD